VKDKLLVFGGGPLQLSIIGQAKAMGYEPIVIDPDQNAPASNNFVNFYVVAGDDFEKTLKIARDNQVKGIVTAATDKPILMMCRIAAELGLPFPSYESCETLLDKAKFKKFLNSNDLSHAKGGEYKGQIDVINTKLTFPVITKPVTNSGSRGVIKCNDIVSLQNAITETLKHTKDGRYLIEEYIEGDEISVEALVQDNKVHILQITDKIVTLPPYNVELGHVQPSKFSYLKQEIKKLLQTIVEKTGLNDCALHPELKVKDNQLTVIEIGPRLGGDFITSHLVPLSTGVNMEGLLIQISLGIPISFTRENNASMVSYLNFEASERVLHVITDKEIKQVFPFVVNYESDLKLNDVIQQITNSLNRYGQFILVGKNVAELMKTEKEIKNFLHNKLFN
jgi:carbamoyl-phosphate synthase large subunit